MNMNPIQEYLQLETRRYFFGRMAGSSRLTHCGAPGCIAGSTLTVALLLMESVCRRLGGQLGQRGLAFSGW